ncbi:MAG: permease-like cell division protein FtsX [Patescibacteria group bacterium]
METLLRIIKLGYNNFWRNRWLTLGATLLMTLTLVMVSVSLLFSFIVGDSAEQIRSRIDVTIYFRDDKVPDKTIVNLGDRIALNEEVNGVKFIDKSAALERWNRLPINDNIKKPVTAKNNPLPRSLEVDTKNPEQIEGLVGKMAAQDTDNIICDECVSYSKNRDTVNNLIAVTKFVQRTGIFLSIFFGIIAIFNVLNIIRITITARSDEIEIMRYVGASNSFVRGPFIVEGIFYGVFGTVITTLFLLAVSAILGPYLDALSSMLLDMGFYQYVLAHTWLLVIVQLVVGLILGVVVSVVSMRRYLRA